MRPLLYLKVLLLVFIILCVKSYACIPEMSKPFIISYDPQRLTGKIDQLSIDSIALLNFSKEAKGTSCASITLLSMQVSLPPKSKIEIDKIGVYLIVTDNDLRYRVPNYAIKPAFDKSTGKYELSFPVLPVKFRIKFRLVAVLSSGEIGSASKEYMIISDGDNAKIYKN